MNINIIYEDNHLLVVEKPFDVLSQKDNTNDLDMLELLKKYLKDKYSKKGNVYLGLIHRLDRPVGGVMVFAKTSKAASRLSQAIRSNEFKKRYLVVVNGVIDKNEGTLRDYLLKDRKNNMVSVVKKGTANAKDAVLQYRVLQRTEELSLLMVELVTGRSHQIRVQFSSRGNPLYGDLRYGGKFSKVGQRIALWSYEVEFVHPVKKEVMKFNLKPKYIVPWKFFSIKIGDIE